MPSNKKQPEGWGERIARAVEKYAGIATPSGYMAHTMSSRVANAFKGSKKAPKPYKKAQPKSGRK